PLDVGRAVLLLPRGRRVEDHDVAALVRVESRRQLVDEDVLVRLERRLHRLRADLVRLRDERLNHEEDDEGEDERLDDLEEAPEGASGHKSGSIWCGAGTRRGRSGGPPEAMQAERAAPTGLIDSPPP